MCYNLYRKKVIIMLKSHVKFNSKDGKRLILIVDDEKTTREILRRITENDFDALLAEDGKEALEKVNENADFLSVILLDLILPDINGFEIMRRIRTNEKTKDIPIIVLTADKESEVKSLEYGASDFIVKPFRSPESILARMQRTIELYEDRMIIQSTERDEVTGLFTKDYFYRYCERYDRFHPELEMDCVIMDINHFHLINELYGRDIGDRVLIHLGDYLKGLREETNCIVGRSEGDRFLMYIKSGIVDHMEKSRELNSNFANFKDLRVTARCGIYANADKSIPIQRRFDRALRAANTIKGNLSSLVAFYDAEIHEKKIFEQRLLNEIEEAIADGQFYLDYQPKYNIKGEKPVMVSAEALVRWKHPQLGVISPGVFIPILEHNGLVHKLDFYIWAKAMELEGRIKKDFGVVVPISVNVSRMDLYHHDLLEYLSEILVRNGLDKSGIYLEITESAYAEDTENKIAEMIDRLSAEGFKIEMDDFGTGYSSLNMLADIPVDVLKLDMRFVQNLRSNEKQEMLVRMVLDIAEHMNLQVIAEGVEDEEQVDFLKSVGCDIIQGYYFSKPLSEEDFVKLVRETYKEKQD